MAKKFKLMKKDKNSVLKSNLARYLLLGLDLSEASKLVGCSQSTLNALRATDFEFEDFVQNCLAQNKAIHLANIDTAGKSGAWQASAWYLERKFPNEFGKRDIVRNEYIIKIQTLQSVLVKAINEVLSDYPQLKYQLVQRLRNFEFNGEGAMDNTFNPKQLPGESPVIEME